MAPERAETQNENVNVNVNVNENVNENVNDNAAETVQSGPVEVVENDQYDLEGRESQKPEADKPETKPEDEKPKRKVVLSNKVKVVFNIASQKGCDDAVEEVEEVECNRDLYSVMDAITARLAATKSKEEMEAIFVSVHSIEDESKSDPLPEGEPRFVGPYLVAGLEIERKPIPEAMNVLASGVIPGQFCLMNVERLAEQLFLRSRMDAFVFVCTFDGVPAVVPLINSMREMKPEFLQNLYQSIHTQAENLRKWIDSKFPDIKVEWDKPIEITPSDAEKAAEERAKKLVLPSGLPASKASEGVKTPEEIRKAGPRILHLM